MQYLESLCVNKGLVLCYDLKKTSLLTSYPDFIVFSWLWEIWIGNYTEPPTQKIIVYELIIIIFNQISSKESDVLSMTI